MAPVPEKMFVRPAMGKGRTEGQLLTIRDPISMRPLKEEGEMKTRNPYWLRRVKCGDCLTSKFPAKSAPKAVAKKSNPKPIERAASEDVAPIKNEKNQGPSKPKEGDSQ